MKENITENKFYKVTQTEVYKIIVAIVLCVLPFTFCSMRLGWVFIDGVLFAGFCLTINILMALNAVYYLLLVDLKNKIICAKGEKVYFNLTIVHFAFAVFYLVVNIANLFYDFKQIGVYAYYFGQLLPYVIPTALCMICLLLVPKIKQGLRAVVAVSIITIVGFSSLLVAFEVKKFDFTATPAVFELGNDTYAVVFVTTHDSAGYLEYKNGDEFVRVYDNVAGGKVSNDNIHSIIVKKDKLINNEYRVGASRVLDHLGNSASLGKSIISDTINFKGAPTGDVNLAMLADVHGEVSPAVKALETFDNSADGLILLGDMADMYNSKSDIETNIFTLSAQATKGEIPVFFARGNHETRSASATEIYKYIPISTGEYYYGFEFGNMSAMVVDFAEDKEDSHIEYGGLADYNQYRIKQEEWLKGFQFASNTNIKHNIIISHVGDLVNVFGSNWTEILGQKNADLLVSGHIHTVEYFDYQQAPQSEFFPVYIAGGHRINKSKFIASMMTLTNDSIQLIAQNENGEVLFKKVL